MKYRLPLDSAHTELIFAPFHDPQHAPWITVHIESEYGDEVVRDSLWDSTTFSWTGQKSHTRFMLKAFGPLNVKNYDTLILCLALPKNAFLQIALIDTAGEVINRWTKPMRGEGTRQELAYQISSLLPIFYPWRQRRGAGEYAGVALRITSDATDIPVLSINWFALRNSEAYKMIRSLQRASRPDWTPWILPDDAWGNVRFERGLLFDVDALLGVRKKLNNPMWRTHFSLLEKRAAGYLARDPEADFGEYLPNHDARYIRESQRGRTCYHWEALVLAFVGLVKEDREMIRHALRYLMCMVHTRYWTESGEHNIPSSSWSHLCFQEEMTTTSVAILFDWLGFALFPRTHDLIRKALLEKGMAPITRDLSSRESIHQMNQGAVFNRALVLGGLMLESKWPYFGTQTVDNAYASMDAVLDIYVIPDGGVHEGIGYLCQTMNATLWATIAYGRARKTDWEAQARLHFEQVGRYVAAMSTMHPGKAIPAGDCRVEWFGGDGIPIMAAICPESPFANILGNCLEGGWVHELTGTLAKSGGMIGMVYGPDEVHESRSVVPAFDFLPQSGKVTMSFGGNGVPHTRLWISGAVRGATHVHRDLGQFVLEVDSAPIFVDRGMLQYWFAEAHVLSRSWLHNVLTPINEDESFSNQSPPLSADPMEVSLDHLQVQVPGCGVWRDRMKSYLRRFSVDGRSSFLISDEFTPAANGKVAFHLHSLLAFQIQGKRAFINTGTYVVEIAFPWAEAVECREILTDLCSRPVFHICAKSFAIEGDCKLETSIKISAAVLPAGGIEQP